MHVNGKNLTQAEVSVLSGRISNPRVPPKSKEEAKAHLKLIEQQRKYERQLMEKEAGQQRNKRDNLEYAMKEWEELLPEFEEQRFEMRCQNVWRYYPLPAPYRGSIWKRCLGNPGGVTDEGYRVWLQKAKDRQAQTAAAVAEAGGGTVPMDEAMRKLLDEDPNYFSPKSGKDDSANLIAVDLPRTIITRTSADGHRRVDSTVTSSSRGQSPTRGSYDGLSAAGTGSTGSENNAGGMGASPRSPVPFPNATDMSPQQQQGADDDSDRPQSPVANHVGNLPNVDQASFHNAMFQSQQGQTSSDHAFSKTTLVQAVGQDGSGNLMTRLETCLRCFVEHRPDMGYVQGMSYLAAMLLMNMSDRDAFVALTFPSSTSSFGMVPRK